MALNIDQPLYLPAPRTGSASARPTSARPASGRPAAPPTVAPLTVAPAVNQADTRLTGSDQFGISDQKAASDGEFTFWDFLDIINPLQHIPVVSTLYRSITGDEIGAPARVIGDTLYGGPIGLAMGVINTALENETGKDVGEHLLAFFDPAESAPADNVSVAEATAPPSQDAFAAATPDVSQLAGTAFPQAPQQTAYAQKIEPPPPVAKTGRGRARGPLFSMEKGFSPYAPLNPQAYQEAPQVASAAQPSHQPPPGRLYGNTNIPLQMAAKPASDIPKTVKQTPPPGPATPPALAKGSQGFMQVATFKPDPATVIRALEAQGFNTSQTSHPMLNLGPSANPGPGAGVAGKVWDLNGAYNPTRNLPTGTQAGGRPMIDPALKAKMAEYALKQSSQDKTTGRR